MAGTPENISVTVKLQLEDYIAFTRSYMNDRLKWRLVIYVLLLALLSYTTLNGHEKDDGYRTMMYTLLAVSVVMFVVIIFSRVLLKGMYRRHFENDPQLRSEHVYTFSKEGVQTSSPTSNSKYFWTDIYAVRETPKYFFVYVAMNKAFIIPRTALDNESVIKDFKALLRSSVVDQKKLKLKD